MESKVAEEIIDALGGPTKVSRLCRVRQPSVSGWKKRGIPTARWQYLHAIRPDVVPPLPDDPPPSPGAAEEERADPVLESG